MSNSPLVTYTNLTSNCNSPRKYKIDTITPHCYVGQVTAKEGCDYFVSVVGKRQVSANYVVGCDGSIGLSVEECNRAWTSSNAENDHRAVTIEIACDKTEPYAITEAAYNSLINLMADICKRNGIEKLLWQNDQNLIGQVDKQNITVHKWFAPTACPGDFILSKMDDIVKKVNAKLGVNNYVTSNIIPTPSPTVSTLYRVQVGAFTNIINANIFLAKVKAAGFQAFITKVGNLYKIQVGAFSQRNNAVTMLNRLEASGFKGFIVEVNKGESIQVGSVVRIKEGATTYNGGPISAFAYSNTYIVGRIDDNRVVVKTGTGITIAAVNINDLILVG